MLIIDDDALVSEVYADLLKSNGVEADVATDGKSGLQKLYAITYQLVLLDLMMPEFNGVDFLKEVRSKPQYKSLPILIFSSSHWGSTVDAAIRAGATEVITKTNHTPKQVCDFIYRHLGLEKTA